MEHGTDIQRWGDAAMFRAEPMLKEEGARMTPRVFLLQATPDPLGANAAGFRMYAGQPTYDLTTITDDERRAYWEESLNTHLAAPWEFIDFHFFIEGVTRSFTHQMVRQRTATYAQESLRFAVKEGFASECALPPSLVGAGDQILDVWTSALQQAEEAYAKLVAAGVPAEDARGLLPHCVTTRLNYKTNLRNLVDTLGNRLCTQAQFEWRSVAIGIVKAIREYGVRVKPNKNDGLWRPMVDTSWQWDLIGTPVAKTFTPVCYKANKCVFMGKLDRGCTIRDRVQEFAHQGVPSSEWHKEYVQIKENLTIHGISPEEWISNPWAGLTRTDEDRPQS
jgi:flavin-dependent thymidylate synthase